MKDMISFTAFAEDNYQGGGANRRVCAFALHFSILASLYFFFQYVPFDSFDHSFYCFISSRKFAFSFSVDKGFLEKPLQLCYLL